jgi:hypothetical protein
VYVWLFASRYDTFGKQNYKGNKGQIITLEECLQHK